MEIIPEEWSVRLISPFLIGLSRDSLHSSRNTKLTRNLIRAENIKVIVLSFSLVYNVTDNSAKFNVQKASKITQKYVIINVLILFFSFHTSR